MSVSANASAGVPDPMIAELVGLYQQTTASLKYQLLSPMVGRPESIAFRQAQAAERIATIKAELKVLDAKAAQWTGKAFTATLRDSTRLAYQQAAEAGVRPRGGSLRGSFALIDPGTIETFARDSMADLQKITTSAGARAERVLRATADNGLSQRDINRILAGGVIEGKPALAIKQLQDELVRVNKGQIVTITTKTGGTMQLNAESYAEMIVRTKTREAAVTSRHERLVELGLDLVAITGRHTVWFCTEFLGQVYYIGDGKHDDYERLDELPGGGPPFHPNCSKGTRPWVPGREHTDRVRPERAAPKPNLSDRDDDPVFAGMIDDI